MAPDLPNPSVSEATRKVVSRSPQEGTRTVSSFQGLDEEERELQELIRRAHSPLSKDPTEYGALTSQV